MTINAKLTRTNLLSCGIFSTLVINDIKYYTASHAYEKPDGTWEPVVPQGRYTCRRGEHSLSNGSPFETFEIEGVPGHTGILFHIGNFPQKDSEGCELIGKSIDLDYMPIPMVLSSAEGFKEFMLLMDGVDEFQLEVS